MTVEFVERLTPADLIKRLTEQQYQHPNHTRDLSKCRKVPKFSDTRNFCFNLRKSQTKRPNLKVFCKKHANGIANSEDPDQTAPLGNEPLYYCAHVI